MNRFLVDSVVVTVPTAEGEAGEPKTVTFGVEDVAAEYKSIVKHHVTVRFFEKKLETPALNRKGEEVLAQGTVLTAEAAEKLLAADIPVISVRMEGTEGVEVRKLRKPGVSSSLWLTVSPAAARWKMW